MACNLKNKLKISVHVHRPHPSVPEFLIVGVPVNTPLKMICKHRIPSTPNDNTAEFHITLNFIQFFFYIDAQCKDCTVHKQQLHHLVERLTSWKGFVNTAQTTKLSQKQLFGRLDDHRAYQHFRIETSV